MTLLPHTLGNFRKPLRERKAKKPSAAAKRPGNSPAHLMLIRLLPCCVTGRPGPNDPHHLKDRLAHERGVGRRATDRWAVPLWRVKHDELEKLGSRRERTWFREHGIEDPIELANALWHATGDLDRMKKVLAAHMNLTASKATGERT
jgi:hypothetical protein